MKLNLLFAVLFGIMASSSGVLQVNAATYNYFVDFTTKEVANFDNFRPTYSTNTYDLTDNITFNFGGQYKFDSCPTNFTLDVSYAITYRLNSSGSEITLGFFNLPDFTCRTTFGTYLATFSMNLPNTITNVIINQAGHVQFFSYMRFTTNAASAGRTLSLAGYRYYFEVSYDFDTTYLFNYFLTDQQWVERFTTGSWSLTATPSRYLQYVFTTAGNDEYYIINNASPKDISSNRKKYAINYNDVFFRGESVGAQFTADYTGTDTLTTPSSGNTVIYANVYRWHYLNTSNLGQEIVDAPTFSFVEEDCGDFLSLNVGCFVNNALAYITNDAPIISDAFTLLNAGIGMAAQTFGIIGNFADDNVFGVLVLAGFGFIAVKWFLKND